MVARYCVNAKIEKSPESGQPPRPSARWETQTTRDVAARALVINLFSSDARLFGLSGALPLWIIAEFKSSGD